MCAISDRKEASASFFVSMSYAENPLAIRLPSSREKTNGESREDFVSWPKAACRVKGRK